MPRDVLGLPEYHLGCNVAKSLKTSITAHILYILWILLITEMSTPSRDQRVMDG